MQKCRTILLASGDYLFQIFCWEQRLPLTTCLTLLVAVCWRRWNWCWNTNGISFPQRFGMFWFHKQKLTINLENGTCETACSTGKNAWNSFLQLLAVSTMVTRGHWKFVILHNDNRVRGHTTLKFEVSKFYCCSHWGQALTHLLPFCPVWCDLTWEPRASHLKFGQGEFGAPGGWPKSWRKNSTLAPPGGSVGWQYQSRSNWVVGSLGSDSHRWSFWQFVAVWNWMIPLW